MNQNLPSHTTSLDGVWMFTGQDELNGQYECMDVSYGKRLDAEHQRMLITTEIVDFYSGMDDHPLEGENVISIDVDSMFRDNMAEQEGKFNAYMRKETAAKVAFHLLDCIQQMEELEGD